jgi:hypothetical protein
VKTARPIPIRIHRQEIHYDPERKKEHENENKQRKRKETK